MFKNTELKYVLILASVLVVVYLINRYSSEPFAENVTKPNHVHEITDIPQDMSNDNYSSESSLPSVEFSQSEKSSIKSKFDSKNKARSGNYKRINYKDGRREQTTEDVAKYFDDSNSLFKDGQLANNEFEDITEGNNLASYKPGPKQPINDEDILNQITFYPKKQTKTGSKLCLNLSQSKTDI